jgi:hypothetical protein
MDALLDAFSLALCGGSRFAEQIFVGVQRLLEQEGGGPQAPFQLRFFGVEETAERITVVNLTTIEKVTVLAFALKSQNAETVRA